MILFRLIGVHTVVSLLIAVVLLVPLVVWGQDFATVDESEFVREAQNAANRGGRVEFVPLVGIPGIEFNSANPTFSNYTNAIYALSITLAALFAVVRIIMAGIQYMFSDVINTKTQAKNSIKGALLGLAMILLAVIGIETINPVLTQTSGLPSLGGTLTFDNRTAKLLELQREQNRTCAADQEVVRDAGNQVRCRASTNFDTEVVQADASIEDLDKIRRGVEDSTVELENIVGVVELTQAQILERYPDINIGDIGPFEEQSIASDHEFECGRQTGGAGRVAAVRKDRSTETSVRIYCVDPTI